MLTQTQTEMNMRLYNELNRNPEMYEYFEQPRSMEELHNYHNYLKMVMSTSYFPPHIYHHYINQLEIIAMEINMLKVVDEVSSPASPPTPPTPPSSPSSPASSPFSVLITDEERRLFREVENI